MYPKIVFDLSKRLTVSVSEIFEYEPSWRAPGCFQVNEEQSRFLRMVLPMAVSKEVPDFQAGGHRAHGLDVVDPHPDLQEDPVHLLLGMLDPVLFASDPEESLDSDTLVADAVPRPRMLWIGLAPSGERDAGTHGEKEFEFTITSNEATDYSGLLLATMECWHERHR